MKDEIKNKFAKFDPKQNKSVTETIMQLHMADTEKKPGGK